MNDTPDLTAWIGRTETATDLITPRLLASFEAMLTPHLATGLAVPLGLHWCLSPPVAPAAQLGQDGHPVMGDFLPPVPYSRRMWQVVLWSMCRRFCPVTRYKKSRRSRVSVSRAGAPARFAS